MHVRLASHCACNTWPWWRLTYCSTYVNTGAEVLKPGFVLLKHFLCSATCLPKSVCCQAVCFLLHSLTCLVPLYPKSACLAADRLHCFAAKSCVLYATYPELPELGRLPSSIGSLTCSVLLASGRCMSTAHVTIIFRAVFSFAVTGCHSCGCLVHWRAKAESASGTMDNWQCSIDLHNVQTALHNAWPGRQTYVTYI